MRIIQRPWYLASWWQYFLLVNFTNEVAIPDRYTLDIRVIHTPGYTVSPPLTAVRRFTQAVIESPRLALLVRSLNLYPSDCKDRMDQAPLEALPDKKYRSSMLPYGDAKRKYRRKYHAWQRDLRTRFERKDYQKVPWGYEVA